MHSQPIPAGSSSDPASVADKDDAIEFAVVAHLVDLHPTRLTVDEAVHELADGSIPGASAIGIQDAMHRLVRAGLLRTEGECIVPTRSTLRLSELLDR